MILKKWFNYIIIIATTTACSDNGVKTKENIFAGLSPERTANISVLDIFGNLHLTTVNIKWSFTDTDWQFVVLWPTTNRVDIPVRLGANDPIYRTSGIYKYSCDYLYEWDCQLFLERDDSGYSFNFATSEKDPIDPSVWVIDILFGNKTMKIGTETFTLE